MKVILDQQIISNLSKVSPSAEGSLLVNHKQQSDAQIDYLTDNLADILEKVQPSNRRLLETGTNKGFFSYIIKTVVPDVSIVTFGIDSWSRAAVNILNDHFDPYIEFHLGDSRHTLTKYAQASSDQFAAAWIDGGHAYDVCMSDLKNAQTLKIPHLFVDDYKRLVRKAVDDFINASEYILVDVSDDNRGIAHLYCEYTK